MLIGIMYNTLRDREAIDKKIYIYREGDNLIYFR